MDADTKVFEDLNRRLEKIYADVSKQQGYSADTEKLRLIVELVKEQVQNENSDRSDR